MGETFSNHGVDEVCDRCQFEHVKCTKSAINRRQWEDNIKMDQRIMYGLVERVVLADITG